MLFLLPALVLLSAPVNPYARLSGTWVLRADSTSAWTKEWDKTTKKIGDPALQSKLTRISAPRPELPMEVGEKGLLLKASEAPELAVNWGKTVPWEYGVAFHSAQAFPASDSLLIAFYAQEGSRIEEYDLTPDGKELKLKVTVKGFQLPRQLRYEVRYERR